jgi:hypothetical protein
VVDGQPIPQDRLSKGSVTCSKECYEKRRKAQRAQQDEKECRYCRKPSSFEDREAFKRFRRLEARRPDLVYPEAFEQFKSEREASGEDATPEAFRLTCAAGTLRKLLP